jgi:hypothetical protein
MVEPAYRISGTQILRPRARILRTFGDELSSSEAVAVIELVKNAYDADATRVLVRFQGPLEIGQGRIEVMDNGHGMSLETTQTTWMEPATLFRKRQQRSEQYGRSCPGGERHRAFCCVPAGKQSGGGDAPDRCRSRDTGSLRLEPV